MIALIKTFALATSAVSEYLPGGNKVASSFALATSAVSEQFHVPGTSSISSAFAVKIDRLPDSPPGDNKVAGSFALAYGGYELNGVILDKKLEKTKLIRQK